MMAYVIPYLFYSILSLLGIFLQSDLFSFLQILNVKPDLLLIFAVLAGIHSGRENGAVAGAVLGFWADLLIGGYFGVHILVYGLCGYLFGIIAQRLPCKNYQGYFLSVIAGSLLSGVLFLMVYSIVGRNLTFSTNFGGIVLPATFYNGLLTLLSFPFIYLYRRFRGLKIGYVDMFGGGMVFITGNQRVDMSLVQKRRSNRRSYLKKSQKKTGHTHLANGKHIKHQSIDGTKRKTKPRKSRPTFDRQKNRNTAKKNRGDNR